MAQYSRLFLPRASMESDSHRKIVTKCSFSYGGYNAFISPPHFSIEPQCRAHGHGRDFWLRPAPNAAVIVASVAGELNVRPFNFKVRHQQGCRDMVLNLKMI